MSRLNQFCTPLPASTAKCHQPGARTTPVTAHQAKTMMPVAPAGTTGVGIS
ncbi:MAG TPA: hypothetical protein VF698_05640 [Thermoanaerobaculia bacterium]|jgi:hypothetical protein